MYLAESLMILYSLLSTCQFCLQNQSTSKVHSSHTQNSFSSSSIKVSIKLEAAIDRVYSGLIFLSKLTVQICFIMRISTSMNRVLLISFSCLFTRETMDSRLQTLKCLSNSRSLSAHCLRQASPIRGQLEQSDAYRSQNRLKIF